MPKPSAICLKRRKKVQKMNNILKLFKHDLKKIHHNVIAWIVLIGIAVVPSLYAWFNIAGSWDPYGSTQNLKVAVANTDQGYEGQLVSFQFNLGDEVITALKGNDALDWVFTSAEAAEEGVKSGQYYAAIIIPEDFSNHIMSLFSDNVQKGSIIYYTNEKENAIAPKVTDKGASAIQQQINTTFIKTVSDIAIEGLQTFYQAADKAGTETLSANLQKNLRAIATDADTLAQTVQAYAALTGSSGEVITTTNDFLKSAAARTQENSSVLSQADATVSDLHTVINTASQEMEQAITNSQSFYHTVSQSVDTAFDQMQQDTGKLSDDLNTQAQNVQTMIDKHAQFCDALEKVNASLPDHPFDHLIDTLKHTIDEETRLKEALGEGAQNLSETMDTAEQYHTDLKNAADSAAGAFEQLHSDYLHTVLPQTEDLFDGLNTMSTQTLSILNALSDSTSDISGTADTAAATLQTAQDNLNGMAQRLRAVSEKLNKAADLIKNGNSSDLVTVENLLSSDADDVSSFLASPVEMKTEKIYAVENYGSAMAPFYTTLAIWVGGVILVAMIRADVSDQIIPDAKPHERYLGRYLIFMMMGLVQALIVCTGDLCYLGIQCEHPFLLILAGLVSSLVYVNMIYTLTISFGDIGKAIAVVIMVLQVAGSGGTFPIEVLPGFFRILYPFMPFAHSMAAMRECIAGMYGMTYWIELLKLLAFMVPSLFLGLVLRKPVIRLNHLFTEKLEDTKLI